MPTWPRVEIVLQAIDVVEALGINPADVAPKHWRQVHNRLATSGEPQRYTLKRQRAWLRRRSIAPSGAASSRSSLRVPPSRA